MGLLGKIVKTTIHTALLPVDAAKDAVTFGGVNTDKKRPYIVERIKQIGKDGHEIMDEVDDL